MNKETTLASFEVKITTEGLLILETKLPPTDEFLDAMDKWNSSYENTPVIASLLDYYKGVFTVMSKDSQKIISS